MKCMYPGMMVGMKSWKAMCQTMETQKPDRCAPMSGWDDSCRPVISEDRQTGTGKKSDLIHTAFEAGAFNTLIQAIKASGLEETLLKTGPFTIFAPRDEAFAALPSDTLEDLLKPEKQAALQRVIAYHIIPGKYTATEVVQLNRLYTLNGRQISIQMADGDVLVDKARIVKTDVMGTNGVIHVIDAVLMPDDE